MCTVYYDSRAITAGIGQKRALVEARHPAAERVLSIQARCACCCFGVGIHGSRGTLLAPLSRFVLAILARSCATFVAWNVFKVTIGAGLATTGKQYVLYFV